MREAWTDERLDDLSARVSDGFNRVDTDIRELRAEMNARFERIDGRFGRIDARFESTDDRLDAMQRTILQVGGATIATTMAGFLSPIATQL